MMRSALIAFTLLMVTPAFAETSDGQTLSFDALDYATTGQIRAELPAHLSPDARARVEALLKNAAVAETADDEVMFRSWRRLALMELEQASRTSSQVAATRH